MLIRAGKDKLAHIRRGLSCYTKCGKTNRFDWSIKNCELCDKCMEEAGKENG
jgi:hypothetical protein